MEAHARHQAAFRELGVERRRALIERALGGGGDASLGDRPGALRAPHVVIGLLGFFYGGPDATNLCYRRRIDPSSCRPLAASGEEPPPIEERLAARSRTPSDGASSPSPPGAPRSTRFHPAAYERGLEPGS